MKRLVVCGLIGFLFNPPLAADTSVPIHFEEAYAGSHPAEFAQLLEQVKSVVPSAMSYIAAQWNLPATLHYPLIVVITENPPNFPAGAAAAYVRSVRVEDGLRQTLIVDMHSYLLNPANNLENLLYHEMAHAILQDAVTSPVSAGIPQWFNEGLAQSVTPEGHDRVAEDFKRYGHSDASALLCDLNGHVDTFYHGEYNFGCYTSFYLAVQRLVQLGGKNAVVDVIAGLRSGRPLPDLTFPITHLDWTAFQNESARYIRDVFSGVSEIPK